MGAGLLTARQVAKLLNVRAVTVYAAAKDGRLPCVRVWTGRSRALVRFRQEDIERLIKTGATDMQCEGD
jgi:excisionase family DNA binding protein